MYMINMNMDEFAQYSKNIGTVIVPIGMTEAHGHHCPLGTDVLIPRRLLEMVELELGERIIIAPEVPYGHSWSLAPFAGTIDIPAGVFEDYVYHIGMGFLKWGFKNVVLFNGHGGNIPSLTTVMEKLADQGLTVMLINWWKDFAPDILSVCDGQGHAGEDETSAVLAIDPSLVDMNRANTNWNRAVANIRYKGMQEVTMKHAQTGDATKATKEKGQAILAMVAQRVVELLQKLESGELIES